MKKLSVRFFGLLLVSSCSLLAQLDGDYSPDLASIEIPVFAGYELEENISATSFSLTMAQGIAAAKLTGSGTISASDFYVDDTLDGISFEGSLTFSATIAKRGSIVTLSGAKATLGKDIAGTGTYHDADQGDLDVTITKVAGAFQLNNASVNLESEELSGTIPAGSLAISGYITEKPSQRGTVKAAYGAEQFGPFDFSGSIINPEINLSLATSSKNKITGTATGTFGDYDDVSFKVTGTRNSKTGISALTLTSTSVKGVSAKVNLDENGDISGAKNSLNVLGYKLTF
ncbi:MAG: hypothetical protein EBS53_08355 [Bacteroidetes bacterium]|nr:hypothetical protein [bacterium]NBU71444.1 hypothetical protein [Bacteroidota bacterium]NBV97290.1 hypothetical protein [Verrucomicrobiota bacterium]